jgi:hypothetical protein
LIFLEKKEMAKVKPEENTSSKAKMGVVTTDILRRGIELLGSTQADLQALLDGMDRDSVKEITVEGPKLLSRGVNSVMQFVLKLDAALKRCRRM